MTTLDIKREEDKVRNEMKRMKNPTRFALVTLAKSLIKARHAREKVLEHAARVNSVVLQLEHAAAQMRVIDQIQTSTTLLKGLRALMTVPQVQAICREMGVEMHRAGMIEEALGDAMDVTEEEEVEAEIEVNKVLDEILGESLSGGVVTRTTAPAVEQEQKTDVKDEEKDADELIAKLSGI